MAREEQKKSPEEESRWSRLSKTASFWILLLLIPVLMIQMLQPGSEERAEISYTRFDRELDAGNVVEVTVVEGKRVEGEFRSPVSLEGGEASAFETMLPGEITEGLIERLKEKNVTVHAEADEQNWWGIFGSLLPWIIIIAFWIWFVRQMQGGGSKAFQFGKSKAKLLSPDTPKVTFEDVAGAEEAKQELEEVIEFLKDPDRFSRLGGRLPKGVLLIGPPGTGKTLLARAVAGEAARPFFQMSGSDFVEMFVGVGASRVRDLFEQAKAQSPCIIFIDELDAVGRHRGAGLGGGHDEREQTLNQLLVEMDGFEPNEGVILLAASNRPDVLDPALLRPGRFDRQVVVDSPDRRGREGILRVHARKVPLADDVDLGIIAKATPGLSGADLENIVNEAALLAARRGADKVTMDDFEEAKDKVMLGTERRSLVLSEDERKLTAYHEAGHALIGLKIDDLDPVHKVTIIPRGRALGLTASIPEEDRHSYRKSWLEGQLAMLFGGRVAEEMTFGDAEITTGAGNDIQRATEMARRMVTKFGMSDAVGLMSVGDSNEEVFLGRELTQRREVSEHTAQLVDREVKRILDEAHTRARKVLEANEDVLEAIAQALLERESLDREEVELLAEGKPLPPLPEDETGGGGELAGGRVSDDGTASESPSAEDDEEDPEEARDAGDEQDDVMPAPAARFKASDPEPDASS